MKTKRLRKSRVAVAMAAVVVTLCTFDGIRREFFKPNTVQSVKVNGSFLTKPQGDVSSDSTIPFVLDENGQPTTAFEGVRFAGLTEKILTPDGVSQGLLVLADNTHPVAEADKNLMTDVLGCKNDSYTLIEEGVVLNEDALEALNNMMTAYNNATELDDFVLYGTTDTFTGTGSCCPRYFQERVTGNTVDLALNGLGAVINYDGGDEEGWVVENCAKYGFIVRYPKGKEAVTGESYCPWHLRYVGKLHAANMSKNDMCLEEYLEFLKGYTFESPYNCEYDGAAYEVYYVPCEGEETSVRVPLNNNYSISGNNTDGFIITRKR